MRSASAVGEGLIGLEDWDLIEAGRGLRGALAIGEGLELIGTGEA